jgi:hypothetical protein
MAQDMSFDVFWASFPIPSVAQASFHRSFIALFVIGLFVVVVVVDPSLQLSVLLESWL